MSLYDWLLFLHVLAFSLVSALVVFWTIGIVARNVDRPSESLRYFRVAMPANVLVGIGTVGTLIFGVWLAIERDEYQVWDGWILVALVLWAIATELGRRGGMRSARRSSRGGAVVGRPRRGADVELRTLLQDRRAIMLQAPVFPGRAPDPHRHDLQARSLSDARSDPTGRLELPAPFCTCSARCCSSAASPRLSSHSGSAGAATTTLSRLGFWSLLVVAFPAWWLMRIDAQWIASQEGFDGGENEPAWLGIGYTTAEGGGLPAPDRDHPHGHRRSPDAEGRGGPSTLVRVGAVLSQRSFSRRTWSPSGP